MELFRIIKKDARKALHSCGGRTVAGAMIFALAYLAVYITETIVFYIFCGEENLSNYEMIWNGSKEALIITIGALLLYYVLVFPLAWGYKKLTLAFAEGKDESINTLFDMYSSGKKYFSSVLFTFLFFIKRILVLVFMTAPGLGLMYCSANFIPRGSATLEILRIGATIISGSVAIVGGFGSLAVIQRWHLAPYYFASGSGICKSFALSVKASAGIRGEIFRFKLSFIGWALLSFFVLPLLYSVPYYFMATAIHAKYLMEKYEHSLAVVPENLEHGEEEAAFTEEKD